MEQQILQEKLLEYHPKTSLTIISKGRVVSINFEELVHARKVGGEIIVYTDSQEYITRYSLQDILNELPVNEFFKVHKSHVVSMKKMKILGAKKIRIGDRIISLSKYYKVQMLQRLGDMLEQQYDGFGQVSSK